MGPGHFAVAFAAKPAAPKVPLGVLLVASEALDLLCFGFAAVGLEKIGVTQVDLEHGIRIVVPGSIPWSHGLFMSLVWSVGAAALAYLIWRDRRAAGLLGLVVFSHWLLDFIVHTPDLPLLFNAWPLLGLGLWGSGPGLVFSGFLEVALLAGGGAIYLAARKQRRSQATSSGAAQAAPK
jgi:hypothetical protein